MARTRGNSGIIGQAVKPGTSGIIAATDAAEASLGGAWPGSTSQNVIYISGTGGSGYAVTTIVTGVTVTNSSFANTGGLIGYSNSFVKVFGAGFIANTAVVVNANTVPQANVTYTSSSELRVALPVLANIATVTFSVVNPSDNSVDVVAPFYTGAFLVVGGGGAGGYQAAGGGGAGGFLSGNTTFVKGLSYPIIVGKGGFSASFPPGYNGQGPSGNTSSFHVFTAYGGGGGGASNCRGQCRPCAAYGLAQWTGIPGSSCVGKTAAVGSGGGGSTTSPGNPAAFGGRAVGSPAQCVAGTQGYPGGKGTAGPINRGGGGGGAGASGSTSTTGCGGVGKLWPYTGLFYAGGGGGGAGGCQPQGAGGNGGGGNGGSNSNNISPATNGRGGGGGGGGGTGSLPSRGYGGSGGPGVVILAIPNAAYPGTTPGCASISNPPSAPGMTVLTYPAPPACSSPQSTYTFIA
jgi:hypothetical protein